MVTRGWDCRLTAKAHFGVTLSVAAFRKLGPELRRRFEKHTPPVSYIRSEDPHR